MSFLVGQSAGFNVFSVKVWMLQTSIAELEKARHALDLTHLRNCMRTLLIPPLITVPLTLEPDGCVKPLIRSTLWPT